MRVFVTGATGFVGSAIVQELIGAGHEVLGLVRSDASAKALQDAGGQVHRGDLEDLDSLRRGAAASEAVIHTAFIHDFSKFAENCAIDGRAIEALGEALAGSDRPLIVTSGTGLLVSDTIVDEDTLPPPNAPVPRVSEKAGFAAGARGVRASVVRLPPTVHGAGDHGFVPMLIALAREKGCSAYIGEGLNQWPAVHRLDAGKLYRLVLEHGVAGARYHAIAEQGVTFRDIAGAIARGLGVKLVSKTPAEAGEHFGWFAHFAGMGNRASSAKTREALGWEPAGVGLLEDIENAGYFSQ